MGRTRNIANSLGTLTEGVNLLNLIPVLQSDPISPSTNDAWVRDDTGELCVKTSTGTLRFSSFQFVGD